MLGFQVVAHPTTTSSTGSPSVVERDARPRSATRPVYVSVDIDVLDPAHAPGTGTPEAGGMTSRELLEILRGLAGSNLVGADIVEVAPAYDHAEITGIAAAHVAYELLSVLAARPDDRPPQRRRRRRRNPGGPRRRAVFGIPGHAQPGALPATSPRPASGR